VTHIVQVYKKSDYVNRVYYSVLLRDEFDNDFYYLKNHKNVGLYIGTSYYLSLPEEAVGINVLTEKYVQEIIGIKIYDKVTIIRKVEMALTLTQDMYDLEVQQAWRAVMQIYSNHLTNYLMSLI